MLAFSAGHVLLPYRKADPLYDQFSAVWTEGVFSCVAGNIPDIDIAQPLVQADLPGADQGVVGVGGRSVIL